MSKVTPTRRSRASARIHRPVDYWEASPGQADIPDEPQPMPEPRPGKQGKAGVKPRPEIEKRRRGSHAIPDLDKEDV